MHNSAHIQREELHSLFLLELDTSAVVYVDTVVQQIGITYLTLLLLLLLLKSVEFDDDVALLLSVAGLVMGPHVTSESEIGCTDSAALRTSRACLRLCGNCVTLHVVLQR